MRFIEYDVGAQRRIAQEALVNSVEEQGQNEDGSAGLAGRRGPADTWPRRFGIRSSRARWSGSEPHDRVGGWSDSVPLGTAKATPRKPTHPRVSRPSGDRKSKEVE
jgi:hypothetical protein